MSSPRLSSSAPNGRSDKPETPGTYYFRFRSVEPDGFVGPYSNALKIEVPRDWNGAWRVLLPMLLVL